MMIKHDWQEQYILNSQNRRAGFGSNNKTQKSLDTRVRMRIVWAVFVTLISLTISKILYLQVIAGGQHQLTSYSNHVELIRQEADRGKILDRRGEVMPKDAATSQVVGYMSEVNSDEIGCFEGICYSQGMKIGRSGIEKVMEATLKGRDGGRLVEVDSSGKEVRELGNNAPEPGTDVSVSIDNRLQEIMYSALGEKAGSAVALDMQGKVLGLVSSPSYDPNNISKYLKDTTKMYFLNRAIAGAYPPGSVYKLVTSYAGLVEGKIVKDTTYEDTGEIKIGTYRYGNWYFDQYGKTEGAVNLVKALSRSNDIYFYKVGEEVGVDKLVFWSKKFGLGEKTGIELTGERAGVVPDRLYKERITGEKWFLGNTYHMSIGQGDLLVTPLQVARMTLAAVSGRLCNTSLLKESNVVCRDLGLSTENIALVREGMKGACAPGGTAFPFFNYDPWILCKTGTAQQGLLESDKSHAWITIAYPGENPEMILTVMLEAGGEGSSDTGPIAKNIIDQWKALGK